MRLFDLYRTKPTTMTALTLGAALIILFPFGLAASLINWDVVGKHFLQSWLCDNALSLLHMSDARACESMDKAHAMLKDHRWWEVIAFFWTVAFTALFLWFELPEQYQALNRDGGLTKFSLRLILVVFAIMFFSIRIDLYGIWIVEAGYRSALLAKVILAATFVGINFWIVGRARKLGAQKIADDFASYNTNIDMPSLFALSVLSIWDFGFASQDGGSLAEFISGASSVVLITTGFLFGVSIVRDAPGPIPPPNNSKIQPVADPATSRTSTGAAPATPKTSTAVDPAPPNTPTAIDPDTSEAATGPNPPVVKD